MGKLKKGRRNQKARLNPVARKNAGLDKQDAKDEATRVNKIAPMISKLSSSAPNDRSMAINAIMVLAEDPRLRRMLLKERLVATVMEQTLNDSNDEIVVELFGLLRNLAIEEGHDVAKHIWRLNIWPAIDASLQKIQTSFQFMNESGEKKLEKKRLLLLFDFTENVLSLIVAIASCSDELYESVYSKLEPVLKLVLDLLNWNVPKLRSSTKLFNALLDFIYEFASDFADFVAQLTAHPDFDLEKLHQALSTDESLLSNNLAKVYVEGIRFHLYEVAALDDNKEETSLNILRNTFAVITAIDLDNLHKLLYETPQEPIKKEQPKADEKPKDIDVPFGGDSPEKTRARADLQAIDVTIDIFTTVCEYLSINDAHPGDPVHLHDATIECLLQIALPSCVHLLKYDNQHEDHLALTLKLLIAVNNLCWLLLSNDTLPVAWYTSVPEIWELVSQVSQKDNLEQQRVCLSILWGLSKSVGGEVKDKVGAKDIKGLVSKINTLTENIDKCEDPTVLFDFILSGVGFAGTVAQLVGTTELVRLVGEFLMGQAGVFLQEKNNFKEGRAIEIALESLNLIYDIFGDAEYPYDLEVFVEGQYLDQLQKLEPAMRGCYKSIDKNRSGELKLRAEEVWTNLGRFIEYKKMERLGQ